jgi:Holliday junction resolvasome RuvABC DNA-binding subunit
MGTLVASLINLGCKPLDAERAAAELAPRANEPLNELVREALKRLVR